MSDDQLLQRFPILVMFAFEHLPPKLQAISHPYCMLARTLAEQGMTSKHPAEAAAGMRKLLEAKDCAVRASLG